jgi:hypothetical protein
MTVFTTATPEPQTNEMSEEDLAEFQRVCAMTEEEYLLYWQEA